MRIFPKFFSGSLILIILNGDLFGLFHYDITQTGSLKFRQLRPNPNLPHIPGSWWHVKYLPGSCLFWESDVENSSSKRNLACLVPFNIHQVTSYSVESTAVSSEDTEISRKAVSMLPWNLKCKRRQKINKWIKKEMLKSALQTQDIKTVWFHSYEVCRVVKFIKTERQEVGIGSYYLVDTEFKFCKMETVLETNGGDVYTIWMY